LEDKMDKRARTTTVSLLITILLLTASVSAAFAAPPLDLHIEVDELIGTSGETFVATGPAVDAGVVCPTGTVDDVSVVVSGSPTNPYLILHVLKKFTCQDGSGTFDLKLVVRLNNTTRATTARWHFVSGTGNYAGLHGNGSLVGTPIVPGASIHDVYDGKVH
jgi:hypothetical protein